MIRVQQEDFDPGAELAALTAGNTRIGGAVSFVGLVRDMAGDARIGAMTLEHYPGMTEISCTAFAGTTRIVVAQRVSTIVDADRIVVLEDGKVVPRRGAIGPPVDPALTTRAVEFNDLDALERELAHGDVACVLTEPALTNIGIVLPDPGFHEGLRALTRKYGTLLIIDETHTICAGPGGATRAWNLEPDLLTIGKPLASGIPAATYGMSADVARRAQAFLEGLPQTDVGGVGGTLAANPLSLAAMRTTLREVLTEEAFARMIDLGGRWADGVRGAIERQIAQSHLLQRHDLVADVTFIPEKFKGFVDTELQYVMYRLFPVSDFQHLLFESSPSAGFAGEVHVGEKLHLDPYDAFALARFAASSRDVEGKVTGRVASRPRVLGGREDLAHRVKRLEIRDRIGARRAPDRGLVNIDDFVEMLQSLQLVMRGRVFECAI